MEIDLNLIYILITVIMAFLIFLSTVIQRITKLEACVDPDDGKRIEKLDTKLDLLIDWVASLNGEISDKKFLKKLKKVTTERYNTEILEESKKRE